MCTAKLTYDPNNLLALQHLAALLATGQFTADEETRQRLQAPDMADGLDVMDVSEPWLYEDDCDLPIPSDRNLSLDELESLVVADIRSLSRVENGVQI